MNDQNLLNHQIKTVNTLSDLLFGTQSAGLANMHKEFPLVPQMIIDAQIKAKRLSRLEELSGLSEIIKTANLIECKLIICELIDRVSDLTGCAHELEDAAHALTKEIEVME